MEIDENFDVMDPTWGIALLDTVMVPYFMERIVVNLMDIAHIRVGEREEKPKAADAWMVAVRMAVKETMEQEEMREMVLALDPLKRRVDEEALLNQLHDVPTVLNFLLNEEVDYGKKKWCERCGHFHGSVEHHD